MKKAQPLFLRFVQALSFMFKIIDALKNMFYFYI